MNPNQTQPSITDQDVEDAIACEIYIGGVNLADSMRFLWAVDAIDNLEERIARGRVLDAIPTSTPDEVRSQIDAASSIGPAIHSIGSAFATVTICLMVLQNGTKLVGVNYGPVSEGNFDADKGRAYARHDAIRQIWPLLGFELRNKVIEGARAA